MKSNSTRIPESVYRDDCFKGSRKEQAELFSNFCMINLAILVPSLYKLILH